jgi:hypothetical protein
MTEKGDLMHWWVFGTLEKLAHMGLLRLEGIPFKVPVEKIDDWNKMDDNRIEVFGKYPEDLLRVSTGCLMYCGVDKKNAILISSLVMAYYDQESRTEMQRKVLMSKARL